MSSIFRVGSDGAVCISVNECPGVVYAKENQVCCTTCKHQKHSCVHVKKILSLIRERETDIHIPPILQVFASCTPLEATNLTSSNPKTRLQSTKTIPFNLPSNLSAVLAKPCTERFNIEDGVCNLKEEDTASVCAQCGLVSWCIAEDVTKSTVVTRNKVLSSKSKLLTLAVYDFQF